MSARVYTLLLCGLLTLTAIADEEVTPGYCDITTSLGLLSIETFQAPLASILSKINRVHPAEIQVNAVSNRLVTVRYLNQTVDELLSRLGVNYVLFYEQSEEDGEYELSKGRVFQDDAEGVTEYLREVISHIRNLHDDDIPFNALTSMNALYEMGDECIPQLEKALWNTDYQARQCSAEILSWLGSKYEPSHRFLDILIEGMKDDQFPGGYDYFTDKYEPYTSISNARRGYQYFLSHPELIARAEPLLRRHLYSDDGQLRFLTALLLAELPDTSNPQGIAEALAPHLQDNNLGGDAGLAVHALARLGDAVRPVLYRAQDGDDEQAASLATHILAHFDGKTDIPLQGVVTSVYDPVLTRPPLDFEGWVPPHFPDLTGQYGAPEEEAVKIPLVVDTTEQTSQEPDVFVYTVSEGETLDVIARNFAVLKDDLIRINMLSSGHELSAGMQLEIPVM
ncbi:MAG: LysM peptidoglycan-binding domain-containing protein [Verrucomicrobia bacterium]|nr:LysM peptidoglycan-binding domain-containing protein [Verrucomicrobiota bacterium]